MFHRIRTPSPALVISLVALFVALGGTAVAAGIVPLAQRALVADNAKKLQGKDVAALLEHEKHPAKHALVSDNAMKLDGKSAVDIAGLPSPASSAAGMVVVKTGTWTLAPGAGSNFTVMCDSGQKAVGGGWADPGDWSSSYQSLPTADGGGWIVNIWTSRYATATQTGTLYAVCLK
jgi:hypothetical protein